MTEDKLEEISNRLEIITIILLAKSGISQREIAKMLGMSTKTIVKIFGKNYEKIQGKEHE